MSTIKVVSVLLGSEAMESSRVKVLNVLFLVIFLVYSKYTQERIITLNGLYHEDVCLKGKIEC